MIFVYLRGPSGIATKRPHDPAIPRRPHDATLTAQLLQLPFQHPEVTDAPGHVANVLVQ